jgi:hypothetical protein
MIMADLAKTDVTVTLSPLARLFPPMPATLSLPAVSFGNGVLTYPTHGVPMPAGLFGMKKAIAYVPPVFASGYLCIYDATYDTIRIYVCEDEAAMDELGNVAVPALSMTLFVIGE